MKKVLQVVGGMSRAGAETFLMNVYRKLDKTKFQFDFLVYTDEKQDYEDEIVSLGGRVIHMPCRSGLGMLKSVKKIKKILKEEGPYIAVHAHTLHNSAYALRAAKKIVGIKKITHSHSTHNTVKSNFLKRLYEKWSFKVIRKYSDEYLACGEEAGIYLFGEKFLETGHVINNGVDLDKYFYPDKARLDELAKQYKQEGKLLIGNVARFAPVKNHAFMVTVAKKLKEMNVDFKMLLIGKGELQEEIADKIKQENLQENVELLGLREDIPELLNTIDVFLMPSLFEGNPVTLVEAQASGIPCVISDTITEKIDMGLGLIGRCALNEGVENWATALMEAKDKKCHNHTMIKAAFRNKKYDVESTVEQLLQIYEREGV